MLYTCILKLMDTTNQTDQIESLRTEAGEAGDLAQVAICDRALAGDESAVAECVEVLTDAAAQQDTVAETVAVLLGYDGRNFTSVDGRELREVAGDYASTIDYEKEGVCGYATRYHFHDGSIITSCGSGWDFGYENCWCWAGAGHRPDCEGEVAAGEDR